MGYGFTVTCKCQEKGMNMGVGMLFPHVYEETTRDAKAGKFGDDVRDALNENEGAVIDASNRMYRCANCGDVECMQCLNVYKPKNTVSNVDSDAAASENNCVIPSEHPEQYELIKEFTHYCPVCQRVMDDMTDVNITDMKCSRCGQNYQVDDSILWD